MLSGHKEQAEIFHPCNSVLRHHSLDDCFHVPGVGGNYYFSASVIDLVEHNGYNNVYNWLIKMAGIFPCVGNEVLKRFAALVELHVGSKGISRIDFIDLHMQYQKLIRIITLLKANNELLDLTYTCKPALTIELHIFIKATESKKGLVNYSFLREGSLFPDAITDNDKDYLGKVLLDILSYAPLYNCKQGYTFKSGRIVYYIRPKWKELYKEYDKQHPYIVPPPPMKIGEKHV
ncbi:MAG: hypothetical protein V1775_02250 [Bacteroidota bacterium]